MRAVESTWYRDFMYNLSNTKSNYNKSFSETSSGKKLNHLSDNPADMAYVLTLRSKIDQIVQYDKNIDMGLTDIKTAESALQQVQTAMYSIINLTEQGASETSDTQSRQILADQIEKMREEILNYANTEVNGRYLFAGSATDTIPYVEDTVTPVAVGRPNIIQYQGNGERTQIQADFSVTVDTNIPGNEIFGQYGTGTYYDLFDRLSDVVQHLRDDDTTALGNDISSMNELTGQISNAIGEYGNNSAHLTQIKGMLKSFKSSLTTKMSSLEDADMAQSITDLSRWETALSATLQTGARIQRYSLMNYLG